MRVLGVDPGLRVTGYGVIEAWPRSGAAARRVELLEAGVIRTKPREGIAARLERVYTGLEDVIEEYRPQVLVIEKLYAHYKHPATAILMGHVRGVVCLLSGTKKISLVNIASTHVKKAVTGRGHAPKEQIGHMVQHLLNIRARNVPSDATDALAAAISYAFNSR